MTEIKSERGGAVRIADEVIAVIAGTAALEADGVAALAGNSRKHRAKGVHVTVKEQTVMLGVALSVKGGKKLQEVSREVQQRVKSAVETMTGLDVAEVNVTVVA
ncbi:MAG: Asp23/Gls24 family envelope stress response protein [Defluviitaleaceae bacterium]|nr:Asp23/Gls24 family envelope stress response protein [Defluviitaleaceae bacterium]MCL2239054.1 Asp23/Gls24 family envelope stress response protein [Defluviitaleaceae bacterium]